MLLSLIGYIFCLLLGIWGFYITGAQVAQGTLTSTLDNLFLTMFAALMGVTCFGYLAWRFYPALTAGGAAAAPGGKAAAARFVLPKDPDYVDSHIPMFNKIWIGLLAFTALEVVLAYVQVAGALVMLAILLVLSLIKAAMIMACFMHLKFDHPGLSWVVVAPAVLCILIMCGYFFPDSFRLVELRP
ncbi:MAG: cytochrome C oxidase subunit IV family protein [Bryobacterales bacterium]|nr:cytochrome C oxidase subunit IV family protein [Bryobacterales bacterium]